MIPTSPTALLRDALEPFAAVAEWDIGEEEDDDDRFKPMTAHNYAPPLTVGDLRRARAAFKSVQDNSENRS